MSTTHPIPRFVSTQPGKRSGVYAIANTVNGKLYIGSSANLRKRWLEHRRTLRNRRSPHIHLQRAWNKYSEGVFAFGVLEFCRIESLIAREQAYLDNFQSYRHDRGYNTRIIADSQLGVKRSEETKEKLRAVFNSPECRAKRSAIQKEITNRPEARRMRSAITKISHNRPEVREKISESAKAAHARPDVKIRHSSAVREAMNREETKARHLAAMAESNRRPDLIAKRAAAFRAAFARRKAARLAASSSTTFYHSGHDGAPVSIRVIQRSLFD